VPNLAKGSCILFQLGIFLELGIVLCERSSVLILMFTTHGSCREADITKERIEKMLKAGANVILTTKGIDDMALKVCILVTHAYNGNILVYFGICLLTYCS
jgi:hypothetical protein